MWGYKKGLSIKFELKKYYFINLEGSVQLLIGLMLIFLSVTLMYLIQYQVIGQCFVEPIRYFALFSRGGVMGFFLARAIGLISQIYKI